MFKVGALGPLLCLLALTPRTSGYKFYADRIPNGDHVPHPCKPNYLWHGVGHQNALGGGVRNQFGLDFFDQRASWTQALCQKDSDGDGLTNGQELGDPDCVWTLGKMPNRTTSITHPGVCGPWNDTKCREINTWVSCDGESFHCDALQNDSDVRNVTLRFPPTPVPNTETNYFCMTFDLPGDDPYHLVATEPYIDNANVMHHILVYGCEGDNLPTLSEPTKCGMEAGQSGCNNLISLWQVGVAGSCMNPNAGVLFGKGEFTRILMEFHWNNPELRADYTDSSGMRFFYTPNLRPNSAVTLSVGQMVLEIPPLQPSVQITGSCSAQCTASFVTQPLSVIEGFNHMHYMGKSQRVELFRNNTRVALLTNDQEYSYDAPVGHVHDPPIPLLPGDEIRTTCEFTSKYKDTVTYYGEGTSDEMCFAFLTVYPREGLSKTRTCMGYKEQSFCGRDNFGGCDFSYFLNASIPEMLEFIMNMTTNCQPFGPCTPECARVMEFMKDEPCLEGQTFQFIKESMMHKEDSLRFLSQLVSCRPTVPCPKCSCGIKDNIHSDDGDGNNSDDDTRDSTLASLEKTDSPGGSCDQTHFLNASIPEMQRFIKDVTSHCKPFGPCTPECGRVMEPMKNEPCLEGAAFQQLKQTMMANKESMHLLAQLLACRPNVPCPECRQCHNNDGDDDDDTGHATALAPGRVGVAALLMASFFFN